MNKRRVYSQADTSELENEIDQLVVPRLLFLTGMIIGLTKKEIEIVEQK